MPTVTIHVTQEDIDNGFQCSGSACPIANALARELNIDGCHVSSDTTITYDPLHAVKVIPLPTIAKKFIGIFDSYDSSYSNPFEFEMVVPKWAIQ